jgi:hypothetical protein
MARRVERRLALFATRPPQHQEQRADRRVQQEALADHRVQQGALAAALGTNDYQNTPYEVPRAASLRWAACPRAATTPVVASLAGTCDRANDRG